MICKIENTHLEIADLHNDGVVNDALPQLLPICRYNMPEQTLEVNKSNVVVKSLNLNLEISDMTSTNSQQCKLLEARMKEKYEASIATLEDKSNNYNSRWFILTSGWEVILCKKHVPHLKRFVLKHNNEAADNLEACRKILIDDNTNRYNLFEHWLQHDAHLLAESVMNNYQDMVARNDAV